MPVDADRLAAANLFLAARVESLEAERARLEGELSRAKYQRDLAVESAVALVRRAMQSEIDRLRARIAVLEASPYDTIVIEHSPAPPREAIEAFDGPSKTDVDAATVHGKRAAEPPLTPLVPEGPGYEPAEADLEVYRGKSGTWFLTDDDVSFRKR